MSKHVNTLAAADVAGLAHAWRQSAARRTARWEADDDLDVIDERFSWQSNRRRERHERRRERADESVREVRSS